MGEKLFELPVELRREGLVRRENQGRALQPGDGMGDREGFSATGDAEEHLLLLSFEETLGQLVDGLGLIPSRLEFADEFKIRHGRSIPALMDLTNVTLAPLQGKNVAVLGYGNQGRAHALNLRDSGVKVVVGAREGKGFEAAKRDGFSPLAPDAAVRSSEVVVFLYPDQVIPKVYAAVRSLLDGKTIGFAHGFALHFGFLPIVPSCRYFLVGPKGAGAVLRERFEKGGGLPGVFALGPNADASTRALATAYAKGIGVAGSYLLETTFAEETECDLFGEQAVLCGGLMELMKQSSDVLVKNGHTPEMAFFETCYEVKTIIELWLKHGPKGMGDAISPTAYFGGKTRGQRLVNDGTRAELEKMFQEIRSGAFAKEWMAEVEKGTPRLAAWHKEDAASPLEKVHSQVKPFLT